MVSVIVRLILSEGKKWVEKELECQKLMSFKKGNKPRGKNSNLTTIWKLESEKGQNILLITHEVPFEVEHPNHHTNKVYTSVKVESEIKIKRRRLHNNGCLVD